MADSGKQSPLGVNVLGSILNNTGLNINPVAASYMGASKTNDAYTFGSLVQSTVLRLLTWAINDGYLRGVAVPGATKTLSDSTYNNLISIGAGTIPALGNSKPPTYLAEDPAGIWTTTALAASGVTAPASSGWPFSGTIGQVQGASWIPYTTVNTNKSVTQWGWIRCHALQAWNEFNYNGTSVTLSTPEYKEFCSSFTTASAWINYSNQAIMAIKDSETFLQGIYSNMSDLITADIAGVSQSTRLFGEDLINLGKAINLSNIATFGLPSNLLRTLGLNSAITPDLSLALIAAGLSNSDISSITNGANVPITAQQEQQIYGAFLLIRGVNLVNVLAPLLCNTTGFESLADLLNVKKLFPNSYPTLTVPVYNDTLGLPTNSKTYYLIYTNGGINTALDTPAVREYVGIQIPAGTPPIFENTVSPNNYNELPTGFGAYLRNILPSDQAIAAGAFQYSMRQIRNIEYCDFERFAQVVKGMELTTDLPLTTGTNKPANQETTTFSKTVCALGSGPFGTYTLSDMFGCMSGLPYPWAVLQGQISQLATQKLFNIYKELFLAVTWEQATSSLTLEYDYETVSVGYFTPITDPLDPQYPGYWTPSTYQRKYRISTVTLIDPGGGYGRSSAVAPAVSFTYGSFSSDGATALTTIGTNDADAASNNGGTFGRVTTLSLTKGSYTNYGSIVPAADGQLGPPTLPGAGAPVANSDINIRIQAPPTAYTAYPYIGGVNTAYGTTGWASPMNSTVLSLITDANNEITSIQSNNVSTAAQCNIVWNLIGSNLKREQRTRYTSLVPVPAPKDYFLNTYPMSLYTFVDSVPQLAQDTRPHMAAQTIEAITNTNTVGGQSAIAMMRQERNQTRLQTVGIQLDNNMNSELTPTELKTLLTNGTIPGAVEGIPSPNGNEYTPPAWPGNDDPTRPGEVTLPDPGGIYVPPPGGIGGYPPPNAGGIPVDSTFPIGSTFPPNSTVPPNTGTGIPVLTSIVPFIEGDTGYLPGDGTKPGDLTPIYNGDPNPVVGPLVPVGPFLTRENPDIIIIGPPSDLNPNNLPPNLDPDYTGSTLFPSSPGIDDAIEKVIECNCDCWIN